MTHLPLDGLTCDTVGVISAIVQMIASLQVTQTLKLLTGVPLAKTIQSFDIWSHQKSEIQLLNMKNTHCPTCSEQASFPYLSFENQTKTDVLCGRDAVQIRPSTTFTISLETIEDRLKPVVKNITVNPYLLSCSYENFRVVIFNDGRAIIHGTNDASKARTIYNRLFQL